MDLSTLAIPDYVNIVGQYNNIRLGNTVSPELLERGYNEKQLAILKTQMKGSVKEAQSLNIKFTRPLEEFTYPLFGYIMTLYRKYTDGVLPFQGPLADQPAQIIEVFNTLESVEMEFKKAEMEEQDRQNRKKSGRR